MLSPELPKLRDQSTFPLRQHERPSETSAPRPHHCVQPVNQAFSAFNIRPAPMAASAGLVPTSSALNDYGKSAVWSDGYYMTYNIEDRSGRAPFQCDVSNERVKISLDRPRPARSSRQPISLAGRDLPQQGQSRLLKQGSAVESPTNRTQPASSRIDSGYMRAQATCTSTQKGGHDAGSDIGVRPAAGTPTIPFSEGASTLESTSCESVTMSRAT